MLTEDEQKFMQGLKKPGFNPRGDLSLTLSKLFGGKSSFPLDSLRVVI